MRQMLNIDPSNWLRSPPIILANTQEVLGCFDKSKPVKVAKYTGPHVFYRMAGRDQKGKMADPYGPWWVDKEALEKIYSKISRLDMFEGWMPQDILNRIRSLPLHYRALAAVCTDWNDFREQVILELPSIEELEGLYGGAAPQPMNSKLDVKSRRTPWLPGGLEQVFFKRDPNKKMVNIKPLWVHWIKLW